MGSPWTNDAFAEMSLRNIDANFAPQTEQQVEYLTDKMHLKKGYRLLDLGCGAGRHSIEFARRGLSVCGVDISEYMLAQARERTDAELDVTYTAANLRDLSALGFGTASFDGAICLCESGIGVLGGGEDELAFLREVSRLLRRGGYFALSCFNVIRRYIRSRDENPRFDYINNTTNWSAEVDGTQLAETQRQYTPSEVKLLLTLAGFGDVRILNCADNVFTDAPMGIEDVEMLVIAEKL
ncbi:MAG: class I SAM-dependent methyltransferase [Oscillospiraceae bacterium]|jgi:ubiquinone/menaquinone biosynthesis C-methylase UbiE|nr:class I SAM-dependent methyltransferase [Oscillospiraceae bacterium]